MDKSLTATDALFGFVGWLTSRDEITVFSSCHDASVAVDLIAQYCEKNSLGNVSSNYPGNLTPMGDD